jgi:hypothetical protein
MMPDFKRALLVTGILNVFLYSIGFFVPDIFLGFFVVCGIECVIGLLLLLSKESRMTGAGMILAGALGLLIGFAVCTMMITNL